MTKISLKTKLVWQCRRGMLELDIILIPFLENNFDGLTQSQQLLFSELLTEEDPDLYTWLMGFGQCENESLKTIIQLVRDKSGITS